MILVLLRVNDRDLPLAKRAVKRAIDRLRLNPEARRRVAINDHFLLQAANLLVAVNVLDLRILCNLADQLWRPGVELVDVLSVQRILILRF